MANLNFTTTTPSSTTKLVGFDSVVANGERTYTAGDLPVSTAQAAADAAVLAAAVADSRINIYQTRLGLRKANSALVAFIMPTGSTVSLRAGTGIATPFGVFYFAAQTAITLATHATGTDYAIYILSNGTLLSSANFTAPAGYSSADSFKIGGYHFAPGGNAAAQAGGDSTPAINPHSLWDLSFRPACPDPRGMALIAGGFWADIYLTNTTTDALGTSAYGVNIADGATLAKIPAQFGGNGSTAYGNHDWFTAGEIAASAGKQLPTYQEYAALAYGVTEATARGTDPVTTGLDAARTSRWGIMQATGNMTVWGRDLSYVPGGASGNAWYNTVGGRGQIYLASADGITAGLLGYAWDVNFVSGSRASIWVYAPWTSYNSFGSRFRCDHLLLP